MTRDKAAAGVSRSFDIPQAHSAAAPASVNPKPSQRNGALYAGAEILACAACLQERPVDQLDINPPVHHRFSIVGDLDDLCAARLGLL